MFNKEHRDMVAREYPDQQPKFQELNTRLGAVVIEVRDLIADSCHHYGLPSDWVAPPYG